MNLLANGNIFIHLSPTVEECLVRNIWNTLYSENTKPYFIIQVMRMARNSISFRKQIFYLLLKNYFGRIIGKSLFFVYDSNIYSHVVYPAAGVYINKRLPLLKCAIFNLMILCYRNVTNKYVTKIYTYHY